MAQHACKWRRSIIERPWQLYHKNSPWKSKRKPPKEAEWRADKVWIKTCEECGYSAEVTGIPIMSRRAGILTRDHDPLSVLLSEQRIAERLTMEIVLRELVRVTKKTDQDYSSHPEPAQRPEPLGSAAHSRLVNLTIGAGSDVLVLAYIIEALLHGGLIQVETKNVSKDAIDLQTSRVYLEAHAYRPLASYFAEQDLDETRQEAVGLLSAYFDTRPPMPGADGWPTDPNRSQQLYGRLEEVLRQQYNCLRTGLVARLFNPQTGKEVASSGNWGKYLTLLRLLISLQRQLAHGKRISDQQFSFQILGDSNQLPSFRRDIEGLLDCRLRELNLESFTNLIYCAGPFRATFERQPISGRAGFPFITITEDTVSGMRLTKQEAQSMILIENKLCFEESLRLGLWQEAVVAVLLDGYLATEQRTFLKKLVRKAMPVRIWTDLDPVGLGIMEEAATVVESLGGVVCPVFSDPGLLESGEALLESEKQELEAYCQNQDSRFLELAQQMQTMGMKFPQEKIFSLCTPKQILSVLQGGKSCRKLL
jgi:hypothetical protein